MSLRPHKQGMIQVTPNHFRRSNGQRTRTHSCLSARPPLNLCPLGTPHETKSAWRWRNFTPEEMACRHCGERYRWPDFMDALQAARTRVNRPFRILSGHRCSLHNARVGGAPKSQHLRLAVDIALRGHDPTELYAALQDAGFTGFGFYTTFIHADMGPQRHWYGSQKARQTWQQD